MKTKYAALAAVLTTGFALVLLGCSSGSSPVGTWGDEDGPHLVLAEDGKLAGSDGCNRLVGSWQEKDGTIDFGQVATTMMFCDGVDDWLKGLSTGAVTGNALQILDSSGAEIGSLERTSDSAEIE